MPGTRTGLIFALRLVLVFFILGPADVIAAVKISLDVTDRLYVPREPVMLSVTVCNDSDESLDLADTEPDGLSGHRFFLEVTTPSDSTACYRLMSWGLFNWSQDEVHRGAYYLKHFEGRLLRPGESLSTCFRYARGVRIARPGEPGRPAGRCFVFDAPGTYRVRAVYVLPFDYRHLWPNDYGEVCSDYVDVIVREPFPGEVAAMDAFWNRWSGSVCGGAGEELKALRRIVLDYGHFDLAPHFYLALVEALTGSVSPWRREEFDEAVFLLEALREEHPGFDPEHVCSLLSRAYYHRGQREKATALIDSLVTANPELMRHFDVVQTRNLVDSDVILSLESSADEYVVGEPVKFTLEIANHGRGAVGLDRTHEDEFLTDNIRFEVRYPDGHVEYRRYTPGVTTTVCGFINYAFPGYPLPPGDKTRWHMYPNLTRRVNHPDAPMPNPRGCRRTARLFPDAGRYHMRAIYVTHPAFSAAFHGPGGELRSQAIVVDVRDPTPGEREILEAIWTRPGCGLAQADDKPHWSQDNDVGWSLKHAIASASPTEPMLRYAYFELGRHYAAFVGPGQPNHADKAVPIFEMLMRRYPEFRHDEVRCGLAQAYLRMRRPDEARRVLLKLVQERPQLLDSCSVRAICVPAGLISFYDNSEWRRTRHSVWKDRMLIGLSTGGQQ
jgi:tetratricopeptide (TPR) repeat protein